MLDKDKEKNNNYSSYKLFMVHISAGKTCSFHCTDLPIMQSMQLRLRKVLWSTKDIPKPNKCYAEDQCILHRSHLAKPACYLLKFTYYIKETTQIS